MVMLFNCFSFPDNIYEIVFATNQQAIVAKLLVKELKKHKEGMTREAMSAFATKLHDGKIIISVKESPVEGMPIKKVRVSYNKRQFYDRILTPMKTMGLVKHDMYTKVYRLSDNFNKNLVDIGKMWVEELKVN